MPQEFHVVRCYACQVFQVHQVKKIPKWSCKMCGEKQSLKKVHGCGSSSDCRRHVQKLNMLTGESPNHSHDSRNVLRSVGGPGYNLQHRGWNEEYPDAGTCVETGPSKWHAFIMSEDQEEIPGSSLQEDDMAKMTWSRPDTHRRGKGKTRKRKRQDLQETNDESLDVQSFHQNRSRMSKDVKTCTTRLQDEKNIVPDSQHPGETGSCLSKTSDFGIRQHWRRNADTCIKTPASEINDGSSSKWGQFLHDDNDDNDDVVKGDFCYQGVQNATPNSPFLCNTGVQRLESHSQSGSCTATQSLCYRSKGLCSITLNSRQGTFRQKDTDVGISSHETLIGGESLTTESSFQRGLDKVVFSLEDEVLNEVLKDDW